MRSKGFHRFETRLIYFRQDVELADVVSRNKELMKGDEHIFRSLEKKKHPLLWERGNSRKCRKPIIMHLQKTIYVAFIKELYEEVTEYIRYIIYHASKNGVKSDRIIGEHTFKMSANDILSLATRDDIVKVVVDQVFQQLESERSTIELIRKTNAKLGLSIDEQIIMNAIPFLMYRHIFVHSDGKPNKDFMTEYPNVSIDSKGRISLTVDILNNAYQAVSELIKAYDGEMIKNKYLPSTEIQP